MENNKWISVDNALPQYTNDNYFLTLNNDGDMQVLRYGQGEWFNDVVKRDGGMYIVEEVKQDVFKVTHWMPLPPPPQQNNQ